MLDRILGERNNSLGRKYQDNEKAIRDQKFIRNHGSKIIVIKNFQLGSQLTNFQETSSQEKLLQVLAGRI